MANRSYRILAAAMSVIILSGSMTPPAIRHSHAEHEDSRHAHSENDFGHCHDASHSHHTHSHDHCDCSKCVMVPGPEAHLHVMLFGFSLTLPVHEPHDPHGIPVGTDTSDSPCVSVVNDAEFMRPAKVGILSEVSFSTMLVSVAIDGQPSLSPSQHSDSKTDDRAFLCDAARHAQTGVLLI